jgi:hypothetical protein
VTRVRRIGAGALLLGLLLAGGAAAADESAVLLSLEKAGWAVTGPVRSFSADNLYEEIDGEAEMYLPYAFRGLTVAVLASESMPGAELRVELFRHGSGKDAFGIASQYRYPDQETASVGPATATVSDASLDFFRGEAFVRMRVSSGSMPRGALLAAGRAAVEAIPGSADPPPGAGVLDVPGLVPGTLLWQKKALLGYEALAPGYEARCASGTLTARLLWLEGPDKGRIDRLEKGLPGFRWRDEGEWSADLPQGTLFLRAAGGGWVGVAGKVARDRATPLLDALAARAGAAGKADAPPAAR